MKYLSILFICAFNFVLASSYEFAGLYVDNGHDQTVFQEFLTKQEKREVENEILNLFGLDSKPKPVANTKTLKNSAPKFLLGVYKSLQDSPSGRSTRSEFYLSGRDLDAIDESDAIMSISSKNRRVSGLRHEHGKRIWFDVSQIPLDETIVAAEFRLYKNSNSSSYSDETYNVTIYQVINEHDGRKDFEIVESVTTTLDYEGWLIFNITKPIVSWVVFPDFNKGLYISVHLTEKRHHELKPETIGIVSTNEKESPDKNPFLVVFLKSAHGRNFRKARQIKPRRRKRNENSETTPNTNPITDTQTHWTSRSCQIQSLYVSFKDLKWQNWIIAPDGYGAYYCSGECNFPLNAHMNATNHAIVQTLVHLMEPQSVPKPCCAPTKLLPISVLFFLDETNVILKKYKQMVVKSCGCH